MGDSLRTVAIIQLCLVLALGSELFYMAVATSTGKIELQAPNGKEVASYKAALYWNTRVVVVEPPIRAVIQSDDANFAKLVCGFKLHQRGSTAPPVEIRLRDPIQGTGQIFAKDGVDLSVYGNKINASATAAETFFDFDISAFNCDNPMLHSSRVPVMLRVAEWEVPVFSQPDRYTARIAQSTSIGSIVMRLQAIELHKSADVCRYEIEKDPVAFDGKGTVVPFDIDGAGVIRLKMPLVPTEAEQKFLLRVTASDCSVPESRKSFIRVIIIATPAEEPVAAAAPSGTQKTQDDKVLMAKWLDVPEKLVYPATSGVQMFAPKAVLSAPNGQCVQNSAVVKITVQSSAWDQVCERSIESLYEQRAICQVQPDSVDLLNPHYASKSGSTVLPDCKCCKAADIAAAKLKKQQQQQQQQKLMEHRSFDGVQYYMDVPSDVVPSSHRLGQQFTLHFWLRHGPMAKDSAKEQILCSADERGHNRHHYSVFLHNCKLILLLRQEYGHPADASADSKDSDSRLSAAEWRFRLAEICDSNWHHYAIIYSAGLVKLDIDGRIFTPTSNNPQILEDYPMHRTPDAATRLTIGACWHGSSGAYRQFLKGSLAGLVLLRNNLESDNVIHCLNHCHEKLDFRTMTQLEPGMSVSLNADYTMIEVKGRNASEVAKLLHSIGYTIVRKTAGLDDSVKRSIRLDTTVTCTDPKTTVAISPVTINVELTEPPQPLSVLLSDRLCISGPDLIRLQPDELASPGGVAFMSQLEIALIPGPDNANATDINKLDACVLRTSPDFTAVESISWPAGDASDFGIEGRVSQRELLLEGYATTQVFQRLLSRVTYTNSNPIIRYRVFVLTCSVPGGRIVSNEFSIKLSVLHPAVAKHTVKKQLPDSKPAMDSSAASDIVKLPSYSRLHPGVGLDRNPASSPHGHMAESHRAGASSDRLVEQAVADRRLSVDAAPIAPIIIGLATAALLLVALGLMYLRYRRSLRSDSFLSGAGAGRASGPNGAKVLPVDAESQAEMEWDNSALNITVNPLDNEENMTDSGSEDDAQDDDYVEDELNLDGGSSCSDEEEDIDGMTASGLLMQRSAQIASSEDELDDDNAVVQMVTGTEAIRYGQQIQQQQPAPPPQLKQQLEWDDSSLPDISRRPPIARPGI